MKPVHSIALSVLAGFAIGFGSAAFVKNGATSPTDSVPRKSPRRTGGAERKWSDAGLSAGDRIAAFVDKASELSSSEWPGFYEAQQNSPEWSRLAARLWADCDPQGFWNHLRDAHDPLELQRWGSGLLKSWTAADPDAAMDAVMAITDKMTGDKYRLEVVDTAIALDLDKGLELAAKAGDFNRFSWGPRAWIDQAPEAAARGLATLPRISKYRDFLKFAVTAWATADPQAALDWMRNENPRGNEEANKNDDWMSAGFKAAAIARPEAALSTALAMPDPRERERAIAGILQSGTMKPGEVPALLAECPISTQSQIIAETIAALPLKTPADLAAATEILIQGPGSREALRAVETIASAWAEQDWDGSWQWACTLPDLPMRRKALEEIVRHTSHDRLDQLAVKIAAAPLAELSNELFNATKYRMSVAELPRWIAKLPQDRADWARAAVK